jgi:hypothetical protein
LLKKWDYEARDTTKENKTEGIEFQAQISPQLPYSSGLSAPFFLEFQKDLDDGFIIRTTFELDKNIEFSNYIVLPKGKHGCIHRSQKPKNQIDKTKGKK